VIWRKSSNGIGDMLEFYSVGDAFENGASFMETVKLAKKCNNISNSILSREE
jgi:hypothetical protein